MPAINKPPIGLTDQEILCVIAYLQTLGGTPTVTLQTSHHYYTPPGAPAAPGAAPAPAAASAPARRCRAAPSCASGRTGRAERRRRTRRACRARERDTMKILGRPRRGRRVRAPSLPSSQPADMGRRLVGGDLRPRPIRIHCPDSQLRHLDLHGNRLDCDPGVRVLEPAAPR